MGTLVLPVTLAPIGEVGGFAEDCDILAATLEERGVCDASGANDSPPTGDRGIIQVSDQVV